MPNYSSYRNILKIAYPIMIGSLAQNVIGLIDTAFMGRVGEVELGAAALGSIYFFVLYMMGHSFNNGMQILVARRSGEGRIAAIGKVVDHELYIAGVIILFLVLNLYVFTPHILQLIISDEPIRSKTLDFLHYRGIGIPFAIFNSYMMCFYIGLGNTKVINFTTVSLAIVNIIAAWIFVFGHFGFAAMGIKGAGLASSFADLSVTITYLIYTFYKKFNLRYNLFRFLRVDRSLIKSMLKLSMPIFFQQLITMCTWFSFFLFIEHRGERSLAVSNIIKSIYIFTAIPTWALAQTTNTMVSNLMGKERANDVLQLTKKIAFMNVCLALLISIFLLIFKENVIHIYTNNISLINDTMPVFPVIILAAVMASFSLIFLFAVTGTGSSQWALLAEIISISIYLMYVYITAILLKSSLPVVWYAEVLYWFCAFGLAAAYLRYGNWKKRII